MTLFIVPIVRQKYQHATNHLIRQLCISDYNNFPLISAVFEYLLCLNQTLAPSNFILITYYVLIVVVLLLLISH